MRAGPRPVRIEELSTCDNFLSNFQLWDIYLRKTHLVHNQKCGWEGHLYAPLTHSFISSPSNNSLLFTEGGREEGFILPNGTGGI